MESKIIAQAIKELSPDAEFSFTDDNLETLQWDNLKADRPTDKEILAHCKVVVANIKNQVSINATAKAALLDRLGITEDEAKLLLS
jgi:hypothetical protein